MSQKIGYIVGSLSKESINRRLAKALARLAPEGVELVDIPIGDLPLYNRDLDADYPAVARALKDAIADVDGVIIVTPEYSRSIPGALKNALDWASREPNNALLAGKPAAILGAGGGMGTSRAQYHLRQVCVFLDLHPLNKPEVFANAFAGAFDADGNLTDAKLIQQVAAQMQALAAWTRQLG